MARLLDHVAINCGDCGYGFFSLCLSWNLLCNLAVFVLRQIAFFVVVEWRGDRADGDAGGFMHIAVGARLRGAIALDGTCGG